jgi:hypothetical protein
MTKILHLPRPVAVSLAVVLVAACGGKGATGPTTGAPPKEEPPPPEGMAFKDMTMAQRGSFMKHTVMPSMAVVFQKFDSTKFADFNCKTCHGSGVDDGSFEMPSADLPKLPKPEAFEEFMKDPEHARWVQFMAMEVKPPMAKMLMMTEYNPETNTGEFGCYACHTVEGQ